MFISLRSSVLVCLALCAGSVTPALAGESSSPAAAVTQAVLPQVATPDVLDLDGKPQLSGGDSQAVTPASPAAPATTEVPATSTNFSRAVERAVSPSGDLQSEVAELRAADAGSHELECLATGVYFESKSEPLAGQLAVGRVMANRAASGGRFPPSYCGVLFQRGQFSFIHGRSLPVVSHASRQWQTAVAIAKIVDQRLQESAVGNALFFHARYVSPGWHLKRVAAIGNHIFYR
ncbi:cell wall hydrolase [Sphingomonas sp.]|uniref:cell wall hydrolase n=1 Tax=Sphingomonas sp. TaxID=28214 RepID=UPI0025E15E15|nr:cell wall hydrolase [Sphingomonas sp.]MBV9527542.1 cell wall hydrolase [Sphingomonas sp.]